MTTTGSTTYSTWGSGDNETTSIAGVVTNLTTSFLNFTTTTAPVNVTSMATGVENATTLSTVVTYLMSDATNSTNATDGNSSTTIPSSTTTITTPTTVITPTAAYPSDGLRILAGSFLIILAVMSVIGNFGIMIAFRHRCFNDRALYTFLNNLAITMVCDCAFNAPFIAAAMLSDSSEWLHASFLCPVTSFVFNLIHTQIIMCLTLLVLDRMFSVRFLDSYVSKVVGVSANLLAGYTWIHSMAFTLAIVVTSVKSDYFTFRHLCSVSHEDNLPYYIVYSLLCNIAPWITVMCCYIYIVFMASEHQARDRVLAEAGYDELARPGGTEVELNHAKPVGMLIFLWCLLIGPYHMLDMIYVYSGNTSIPGALWTICICLKYIFNLLVSLVVLVSWPESWKEFKHFVSCRRDNAITETGVQERLASPGGRSSWAEGSDGSVTDRSTLDRSTLSRSFPVPVLFATSNGLQLHVSSRASREGGDIEVADFASEHASDKYRTAGRPSYLPPLFSVTQSSEEDSFNTEGSAPLKGEDNELFNLNESADSKTAISQFQLSLGRSEDFHALKSSASNSPRENTDHNHTYSPRQYAGSKRHTPSGGAQERRRSSSQKGEPPPPKDAQEAVPNTERPEEKSKRSSKDLSVTAPVLSASPAKEQSYAKNDKERSRKTSGNGAPNGRTNGTSRTSSGPRGVEDGAVSGRHSRSESVASDGKGDGRGEGAGRGASRRSSGGGEKGGRGGAVGRGLRSREETERRRHSSGKSLGGDKSSPRGPTPTAKAQPAASRPK